MDPLTLMAIGTGASFLGGLFKGHQEGKISREQLELARQQLGLSREQFAFLKQQAERQNRIADQNVGAISPLLTGMIGRSRDNMSRSPQYQRLAPPRVNNPYSAGGRFGNPAPPPMQGMPWLDYSQMSSPSQLAAATALPGAGAPPPPNPWEIRRNKPSWGTA